VIRRLRWPTVLLAAALVVVACDSADERATEPTPSRSPSDSAFTETKSAAAKKNAEITLAFGGDVHFAERTLKLLDDPATAIGPASALLSAADVAMVNLETAITTRGTAEPKTFLFRAPPSSYTAVAAAGIDVVTVANNHALDYGRVGLEDALNSAASVGMPVVGAGRDAAAAYAPWVTTVKGVKIAFLGISQIQELASRWVATDTRPGIALAFDSASTSRAVAAVSAARAQADVVVVYMHWGQEYNQCPTAAMKTLASRLASAGATLIVGTHAHVLQGDGWLGKTFVAYGLSNFLWWYNDAASNDTGVVRVTLRGAKIQKTEFLPAYIDRNTGQPKIVSGSEKKRIANKFAGLRSCTGLAAKPS
jgi:poly-gamma-glutamate capsule biosynthesis protein CapA/YwtB (metallophosphatase superfamily)